MRNKTVLLAYSGGIDSTKAIEILRGEGFEVTAVTFDLTGDKQLLAACAGKASAAGVDHIVYDAREVFDRLIVDNFVREYAAGRTPAPCTLCNKKIKWNILGEIARERGYDRIATGHYFRLEEHGGKKYIARAADRRKDQSYYLWMLDQQTLSMALTPMGNLIKEEVIGELPRGASRRESMGVCFLAGETCASFLRRELPPRTGKTYGKGEVVDAAGQITGTHEGFPYYTIGQKKGFVSAERQPVVAIDPVRNRLITGPDERLYHCRLYLGECYFVDREEALEARDIRAVIRGLGRNPEGYCRIRPAGYTLSEMSAGTITHEVLLDNPCWAPAPGQPMVFYREDRVIGGGMLEYYSPI